MNRIISTGLLAGILLIALTTRASDTTSIKWLVGKERVSDSEVRLSIKGLIPAGLKLYALQKSDSDALFSSVTLDSASRKYANVNITETGNYRTEKDASLNAMVTYFTDSVLWHQRLALGLADSVSVRGLVSYLYKKGDEYIPGEQPFRIVIEPAHAKTTMEVADNGGLANKSLAWIALIGFLSGLGALLTPCVFSMIPVTASFFTKRSRTKAEGKKNAILYSASIIGIFTLAGFLITLIWGVTALNNLATNWIANLVFFALFFLFGISFLGAFDLTLPSSWTNRSSRKAGTNSFPGIFFMALTLVLVSFSCTGPFIGNLLPIVGKGGYFGPLVGFATFSFALAVPFSLFAFFPGLMNGLAKPGGWMNAVKVTMGFVELALALKFLSNADLARGWRLLDREIFIALWIVIFLLLGAYLLGKLKFHHDDELPKNDFGHSYLGIPRLLSSIAALSFALYMMPGLWGAPLKGISAFVPPMGTQDFNSAAVNQAKTTGRKDNSLTASPPAKRYNEQLHIYEPEVVTKHGLTTYFDYDEAREVARQQKKPLMLDFTGINCVNCRKMEGQVWSDSEVMRRLKEDFVVASLYVDVHNIELPQSEQFYSKALKKEVTTLGDKNADLQVARFGANTQPYYFFLDAAEQRLVPDGYGYDPSIEKFTALLDRVKANYYSKTK